MTMLGTRWDECSSGGEKFLIEKPHEGVQIRHCAREIMEGLKLNKITYNSIHDRQWYIAELHESGETRFRPAPKDSACYFIPKGMLENYGKFGRKK